MKHYSFAYIIISLLCSLVLGGCSDDWEMPWSSYEEGRPARVRLKLDVLDHAVRTRGVLKDETTGRVNSLWIGCFDRNGRLTSKKLFTEADLVTGKVFIHPDVATVEIECLSGTNNIVAVANPVNNFGARLHDSSTSMGDAVKQMSDLLDEVQTIDDYCQIVSVVKSPGETNRVDSNFPMSGVYKDGIGNENMFDQSTDRPDGWVNIAPGSNTLNGVIHLRRHESFVRMNFIAPPNIEIIPVSWKVHNLPSVSFVSECTRNAPSEATVLGNIDFYNHSNYSDSRTSYIFAQGDLKTAGDAPVSLYTDADGNYTTRQTTGSSQPANGVAIEFYTFGNRHTGLSHVANYHDREMQWKKPDGTNTGLFSSLVADPDNINDDNNNATYVTVEAQVNYWVKEEGSKMVPVPAGTSGAIQRTGATTFTVHMGYCLGNSESELARDFNIDRNTLYTYNVIVNGIDNIRVEAMRQGELQPGLEGDVSDAGAQTFELDAHYNQFNIKLSNAERLNFSYQVEVPFNNTVWLYNSKSGDDVPDSKRHFVDWVRFKPALHHVYNSGYTSVDETYMASYGGGSTWTMEQMADPANYNGYMDVTTRDVANGSLVEDPMPAQGTVAYTQWLQREHWYTVFIDENVYYKDENGNNLPLKEWYKYVNKPERQVWLINEDNRQVSADGQSTYIRAKYIISQRSIQTYFSTDQSRGTIATTALGLEHVNETEGLNMTWQANGLSLQENNGRYNLYYYLAQKNYTDWNQLRRTVKVGDQNFLYTQMAGGINQPGSPYFLTKDEKPQNTFALNVAKQSNTTADHRADRSSTDYYDAMTMCMGRNRDLNGDGVIDHNEIRWVLPTYKTYARIVASSESLVSPLINFSDMVSGLRYSSWPDTQYNGVYHFITGNGWYIWAEEGLSYKTNCNDDAFWQLRCARTLGFDFSNQPNANRHPVDNAYTIDTQNQIVDMYAYDESSLRAASDRRIDVHMTNEAGNRFTRRWQYMTKDSEYWSNQSTTAAAISLFTGDYDGANSPGPCGRYNVNGEHGWRVPNQKELTILYMNGIIGSNRRYLSCTTEYYDFNDGGTVYKRLLSSYANLTASSNANLAGGGTQAIRCVRDIMPTDNGTRRSRRRR